MPLRTATTPIKPGDRAGDEGRSSPAGGTDVTAAGEPASAYGAPSTWKDCISPRIFALK